MNDLPAKLRRIQARLKYILENEETVVLAEAADTIERLQDKLDKIEALQGYEFDFDIGAHKHACGSYIKRKDIKAILENDNE